MHVISKKSLREFWQVHSTAENALKNWHSVISKARWENLAELHLTFPHADLVGSCIVFNVGGNNTRVIARVNYRLKKVLIKSVLTHAEYDRGDWKNECGIR